MRKVTQVALALILFAGGLSPVNASGAATLSFVTTSAGEFQPAAGERVKIDFALGAPGIVTLELYSPDGDLVRSIASTAAFKPGRHSLEWDGRDDKGEVVPDEAYHPVLRCTCGESPAVADSRGVTGGAVIEKIRPELSSDGTIAFDLPHPSRTLVRVGIKGGAMMRAIDTWSPRAAGRVRVAWDGYDQSHATRLLGQPGLAVLVTAFTLPDHSLIASGNTRLNYFAYRKARGWSVPVVDGSSAKLERDGKRLARQASLPRSLMQDPRVSIRIIESVTQDAGGAYQIQGPVTFRVDMPDEDKWLVQQSLYEVGFFLDAQFVSEEETGFTPISWRWDPAGTASGEHTMTVNISGFWGQVGVASLRVVLSK